MKNDRFFLGILIGIGAIILLSVVLVLINQNQAAYLSEDTPEGVVNNYLLAWYDEDYEKIESYLMDHEYKPDLQMIIDAAIDNQYSLEMSGVYIESSFIYDNGTQASVIISTANSSSGSYRKIYQSDDTVSLIKQDGHWKIEEFPHPYWGWSWYLPPDQYK
ncbi:MAG: hypothetical protein JEZ00_07500 [Anaerolineaceae bacterium]|nr:hypothetical protein [Anaerolineaceae bacterium]